MAHQAIDGKASKAFDRGLFKDIEARQKDFFDEVAKELVDHAKQQNKKRKIRKNQGCPFIDILHSRGNSHWGGKPFDARRCILIHNRTPIRETLLTHASR